MRLATSSSGGSRMAARRNSAVIDWGVTVLALCAFSYTVSAYRPPEGSIRGLRRCSSRMR